MIDVTNIQPKIDFALQCGDQPGVLMKREMARFLHEVDRFGSLNAAAKKLHMSYSHTLGALSQLEEALGVSLVIRIRPAGSHLTDEGRALLDLYDQAASDVMEYAGDAIVELSKAV